MPSTAAIPSFARPAGTGRRLSQIKAPAAPGRINAGTEHSNTGHAR